MGNAEEKFERLEYNNFLSVLANFKKTSSTSKLCFILGAGASVSSGIPSGSSFARRWRDELINDGLRKNEIETLVQEKGITDDNIGEFYCDLYDLRFKGAKWQGIEDLNRNMKAKEPGFGYTVLAQILTQPHSNVVITTNFDNLVEKSLYIYTEKQPLMLGHEMMAGFAKESTDVPLIIKIHRDLFFKPFNSGSDTAHLQKAWQDALGRLLANRIAIVIGYGGNDGSLMNFLEKISGPEELYWCDKNEPNEKVLHLLESKSDNAHLIEIDGFDELMFDISTVWQLEKLNDEIVEVAEKRAENYRKTVGKLAERLSKEGSPEQKERVKQFVEDAKSWWDYELKVQATENVDLQEKIYNEGIKKFHNSPELNGNYAIFLKTIRKNYDEAEKYYKKALELDPNGADYNGNYATFLHDIRKSYDEAEKYYKKALELDPDGANKNGNYASFLLVKGLKDKATSYLEKAFELCTTDTLLIELWYYRYAHYPEFLNEAHNRILELLESGVRSPGWNFDDNIKLAEKESHPNVEELKRLAKIITEVKED